MTTTIEQRRARLANGQMSESSTTQAVSGDVTTAAAHRPTRVAGGSMRSDHPAEGAANGIEAAKRDRTPAKPASGPKLIFGYRCVKCGHQHLSVAGSKFVNHNGWKRRVGPCCLIQKAA